VSVAALRRARNTQNFSAAGGRQLGGHDTDAGTVQGGRAQVAGEVVADEGIGGGGLVQWVLAGERGRFGGRVGDRLGDRSRSVLAGRDGHDAGAADRPDRGLPQRTLNRYGSPCVCGVMKISKIIGISTALLASVGAGVAAIAVTAPGQTMEQSGIARTAAVVDFHGESVPAALAVPAGQRLVADLRVVQGSQVYQCVAGTWTLLEPDAVLRSGDTLVLHTRGPAWTSASDGSSVTGAAVASVPKSGAVPELLLRATANRGTGLLGDVDFVQRLDTRGGVAPTTTCTDGQTKAVHYSAEYRFFVPVKPAAGN
jgi:Protein of unknown function (DUF3455)